MSYLKINDIDFSKYVNELSIDTDNNYTAQTNAAGDTVVDFINKKRTIEVGIIPLNDVAMKELLEVIDAFNVSISFLNPLTNELESANCILPSTGVEYYTIQANKVMYKEFKLKFKEL